MIGVVHILVEAVRGAIEKERVLSNHLKPIQYDLRDLNRASLSEVAVARRVPYRVRNPILMGLSPTLDYAD